MRAVLEGLDGKWNRADVQQVVWHYAGIGPKEFHRATEKQERWVQLEAAEAIALEMEQRIEDLMEGRSGDLDLDEVAVRLVPDGMNGKIRKIAQCSVLHQLFGHLLVLGLMPLFRARFLPHQHASIPGRGQTGLKHQLEKQLRKTSFGITCYQKTDVKNAYGSMRGERVLEIIRGEIPSARWILVTLEAILKMAPDGCLIIGGYLDAWLFNLMMSYALRYALSLKKVRRGKERPLIKRVDSYMDDFGLLGSRAADVGHVARALGKWMKENLGLALKLDGKRNKFLSIGEEHQRRRAGSPAARGCPGLDMGGYVIHRSYTTIRKKIFLRARRYYLRAGREVERMGTMRLERAKELIAYFGYFKQTNSVKIRAKLRVDELMKLAKHVDAYWARVRRSKNAYKQCCYGRGAVAGRV